ncbi:hypothetical protein [Pseudomonas helleri]|uniref:hypothetical protein n=1 Tax=Pseudomonas helleri TaxID=1608996 RepID=UPI002B219E4B|nr:hypothetical protein [Pseudomonas helleri]
MASKSVARKTLIQPRFMRAGEAPEYLSMSLALFNEIVRPYVSEFPIGERGVGFDRLELDEWASTYVETKAIDKKGVSEQQLPRSERQIGESKWRAKPSRAFPKGTGSGISTRKSTAKDFTRALELVTDKKQNGT